MNRTEMTREEAINYAEAMKAKAQARIEFYRRGHAHAPEVCYSDLAFLSAAISALREQEERENLKPLTLDELKLMDGEPVWLLPDRKCFIVNNDFQLPYGERIPCGVDMWGAGTGLSLLARCDVYRSKPKEDSK